MPHLSFSALEQALPRQKIRSCLIFHRDAFVFEYYKNRKAIKRYHQINSCTKSILSALVGIALARGLIPDIHTPIARYFPNLLSLQSDERKQRITLYHLLTMTAGFDWPEFGEWDAFAPMVYHRDICRFILSRRLLDEPGTRMNYNSGCSHLLAAILHQVTGGNVHAFAENYLLTALGISDLRWYADSQGVHKGADGIHMRVYDMVLFGRLFLNDGYWKGQQLVPAQWIHQATQPRFLTYPKIGAYGYHWWTAMQPGTTHDSNSKDQFYFALGFGGQYIFVVPAYQIVVTFTSDLYHDSLRPLHYFRSLILPIFQGSCSYTSM